MKKCIMCFLTGIIILILCACGNSATASSIETKTAGNVQVTLGQTEQADLSTKYNTIHIEDIRFAVPNEWGEGTREDIEHGSTRLFDIGSEARLFVIAQDPFFELDIDRAIIADALKDDEVYKACMQTYMDEYTSALFDLQEFEIAKQKAFIADCTFDSNIFTYYGKIVVFIYGNYAYCFEILELGTLSENNSDLFDDLIKSILVDSEKIVDNSNVQNETEKSVPFTNKYGTETTKCAHSGCNNVIASSGDTNCCVIHSNRCLNCGKYIDEDATFCMSCISNALNDSSTGSDYTYNKNNSTGNSNRSSQKTAKCNFCDGTGKVDGNTCPWCNGSGMTYDNSFNDLLG